MRKNKKNTAFTIIEVLVAIVIISMTLMAVISISLLGMHSIASSEKKYIAAKMAEEGLELLLNKKENHLMAIESGKTIEGTSDWQTNLLGSGGIDVSWEVDATKTEQLLHTGKFKSFDPGKYLCFDTSPSNQGKFTHQCAGGKEIPGNFTREIAVEKRGLDDRIFVKSIVKWQNKGMSKELILEGLFFGPPDN